MGRLSCILLLFLIPLLSHAQWDQKEHLCEPVSKKRWNKTGPIIGTFLDSLDYSEENDGLQGRQKRLKNLKKWLVSHECVKKAKILPGTIEQKVPLKELLVVFVLNGHENPMKIRIALDVPYSFAGIFQKQR